MKSLEPHYNIALAAYLFLSVVSGEETQQYAYWFWAGLLALGVFLITNH